MIYRQLEPSAAVTFASNSPFGSIFGAAHHSHSLRSSHRTHWIGDCRAFHTMNIDCLCPLHPLTAMALFLFFITSGSSFSPRVHSSSSRVSQFFYDSFSRFLLFTQKFPAKSSLRLSSRGKKFTSVSVAPRLNSTICEKEKKENFELSMFLRIFMRSRLDETENKSESETTPGRRRNSLWIELSSDLF